MPQNIILIKGGNITDPASPFQGKQKDILIVNGIIHKIEDSIPESKANKVIQADSCFVTPGLLDLRTQLKDPGKEHKEDISTGADAAAFGGFTAILAHPTTDPVTQNKASIHYVLNRSKLELTDVIPCGAATTDLEGNEITEMFDMHLAGAKAFSNGDRPFHNSGVLTRALLYCKSFGGLIISHAEDRDIASNGSVNESSKTIGTGLKKRPAIAEFLQVQKEIELLRYTGGKLHFSHISTSESLRAIRSAKSEGLSITCDVSIWHLIYNDQEIGEFDTNFKMLPPLRSESDRLAMIQGVKDGSIDAICSDHNPQNIERKKVEFDYSAFGCTSLQTFYSLYTEFLSKELSIDEFIKLCAINPRTILGLKEPLINVGEVANISVFNPDSKWTLDEKTNRSKSMNNPYYQKELTGRCKFVQNGNAIQEHF